MSDGRTPLLNCPFCGFTAKFIVTDSVGCTNNRCDASRYYVDAKTWNKRTPPKEKLDANIQ